MDRVDPRSIHSISGSAAHAGIRICVATRPGILRLARAVRLRGGRGEALLEIANDIVNVLCANGDADQILRDARIDALAFGQLLVRRSPGMNGEGLGVADAASTL